MEPIEVDQFEIRSYFRIDERIQVIRERISHLRKSFYDQTLSPHIECNGTEVVVVAFHIETNVIDFLDTIETREKTIEILLKRKRYFNDYLDSLAQEERDYLIKKYTGRPQTAAIQQADRDLFDEILEINDAINFIYGLPAEDRVLSFDIETLEDDFTEIAALLGV